MSNNDSIFTDAVWNRIKELLKRRSVKQAWLVKRCKEMGMPISQPELSKLYTGKKKINVYELIAISRALEVSIDFLVRNNIAAEGDLLNTGKSLKLLSNVESEQFQAYLGEFYIYYNKTTEQEDEIQTGRLLITEEALGYCGIKLQIYTKEFRGQKEIVKEYEGRMLITTFLSGAYIVLRSDSLGELCFMALRHRTFAVKQLECRLALCLTMSAGENKVPTVHKMLLSKWALSEEQLEGIRSYLSLYGNVIKIEKDKANQLLDYIEPEKDKDALKVLLDMMPQKQYYEVSIELLRRHLQLDRKEFAKFIASFLSLAETEKYAKIYEQDDNLTYAALTEETESPSHTV